MSEIFCSRARGGARARQGIQGARVCVRVRDLIVTWTISPPPSQNPASVARACAHMVYRPPSHYVLPLPCFTLYKNLFHVKRAYVPRGTKLMLLITNVLACGTSVEHSKVGGLFRFVPGGVKKIPSISEGHFCLWLCLVMLLL
jgi:hypothetical protein